MLPAGLEGSSVDTRVHKSPAVVRTAGPLGRPTEEMSVTVGGTPSGSGAARPASSQIPSCPAMRLEANRSDPSAGRRP